MSYLVSISSPTSRFTTFNLDSSDGQMLTSLRNRSVSGRPSGMSFEGPELLSLVDDLEAVECRGLIGPRSTYDGTVEAVCQSGELLDIAYTLLDNVALTERGIITDLATTVGPGGKHALGVTFTFHPVDCLAFIGSSTRLGSCAA